ncbi:rhodanese-like domain-containing protein [Fulvivirga marina]
MDQPKKIIIHCQNGARATIAESLLNKEGIDNVRVYLGGMNE